MGVIEFYTIYNELKKLYKIPLFDSPHLHQPVTGLLFMQQALVVVRRQDARRDPTRGYIRYPHPVASSYDESSH